MSAPRYPVSVAPMMDWTDRHCRYFLRLVSPSVRLYTEMVTTGALIHGDRERLLAYDPLEHPLALQLGGSDPRELARCARWAEEAGFDEVNLNVGCPSDRVQSGRFGACLMLEPQRVAECVAAMQATVSLPVTVKSRTGVDNQDSYESLVEFVDTLRKAGLVELILHARKAWLKGLSPRENREVPPLHYDWVYRIKREFPAMLIGVNGGIKTRQEIAVHLQNVDTVMIGREAYHNPWLLADVEQSMGTGQAALLTRHQVVEAMFPYIETELGKGTRLQQISRHMLGLFQAQAGSRAWRRYISEHAYRKGAGIEVLERALRCVPERETPSARAGSESS